VSVAAPSHALPDLLERAYELSLLEQCLDGVLEARRGCAVVVAGEAGVGKTSLVRCFCAAHPARVTVLAGNCDALFAPRSLGPVLDIADAVGGELRDSLERGAHLHDVVTALLN
jgi:predicted ATPase